MTDFTANSKIIYDDASGICVHIEFQRAEVDRPCTGGWIIGACKRELAARLCRCIDAQRAHGSPQVRTDINGKTYVAWDSKILGRIMNADLRRLGF